MADDNQLQTGVGPNTGRDAATDGHRNRATEANDVVDDDARTEPRADKDEDSKKGNAGEQPDTDPAVSNKPDQAGLSDKSFDERLKAGHP